jgi:hypothetical protein
MTSAQIAQHADRIAARRRRNPARDARRQAQLTRQRRRLIFVPRYRDIRQGSRIVASVYLGHKAVPAVAR